MSDLLAQLSVLESAAVVFAVVYLVLAIRQDVLCWPAALISATLSVLLFYDALLYMQALLQVFYFGMGVYGWYEWTRGGARHEGVAIGWWSARQHAVAAILIAIATAVFAWILESTNAADPYLDSFTSVAAVVTTYMVARKIIENWIYWFVIDAASAYLYASRGLTLYALLFILYLILVVAGFRTWFRDWQARAGDGGLIGDSRE